MLRIGIVNYLNSQPLAWGLLEEGGDDLLAPSFHPPAEIADLLAAGELDAGLVPSIELQRIPGLRVVPGLCIAATREARSVLLVAEGPLEAVERVAVDENSRTSAALVRILLRDRYGSAPRFEAHPPDLEAMLSRCDAALLIGDPALRVDRQAHRVFDLAAEWRELTGHPFVFALWAVVQGSDAAGLVPRLEASLEAGLRNLRQIARRSAPVAGLDAAAVERYLRENLRYRLGSAELAGLAEFFRRARAHGLIPEVRPLHFCGASSPAVRAREREG